MNIFIRPMIIEDIKIINQWNIDKFTINAKIKNGILKSQDGSSPYTAIFNNSIFGYTEFYYDKDEYINLSIVINPFYQKKKLGKFFLAAIEKYIIKNKLSSKDRIIVWVEGTNKRAVSLYENFGFKAVNDFMKSLDSFPMYYKLRRPYELS